MRTGVLIASVLVAQLLASAAVAAPERTPDSAERWAYELGHELMSPFCPGRTLATCPSPQAADLIQEIAREHATGATREQVVSELVDRFGEEILAQPPAEGIGLWVYVLPVLGFVVGGAIAWVVLRRIVRREPPTVAPTPEIPHVVVSRSSGDEGDREELERLVDADLARRA